MTALQRAPTNAGASEIRCSLAPVGRYLSRRRQGLPGYWAVLLLRAGFEHPARALGDSPQLRRLGSAFNHANGLGTREWLFRG